MATRLALYTSLSVAAAATLLQQALVLAPSGSFKALADTCTSPLRQVLHTDLTLRKAKLLDDYLCVTDGIWREIYDDRVGVGAAAMVFSALLPTILHLAYVSVSPNNASKLRGVVLPLSFAIGGQIFGHGTWAATAGLVLYVAGLYAEAKAPRTLPLLPTPAPGIYAANLGVVFSFILWLSQGFFTPGTQLGAWAHTAFEAWGIVPFGVLLLLGAREVVRPKDEAAARAELAAYTASEVSYSFERTWAYHRQAALISAFLYWFGLSRVVRGVAFDSVKLTDSSALALVQFAGLAIFLAAVRAAEELTIRSTHQVHPITGAPRSDLERECDAAIAKAPAGSPAVETEALWNVLIGVLGGPGAALGLWWAHGEERAGWITRRAWRETAAVSGAAGAASATVVAPKKKE